jgi:hypothetical protein
MTKRSISFLAVLLAIFSLTAAQAATSETSATPAATSANTGDAAATKSDTERLKGELEAIQKGLVGKRKDLEKLHHKWVVAKGRTPTAQEAKDFEIARAKGKVKPEDNPYVNKSALSTPGRARAAYHKMLDEVRADEEKIHQLEKDLNAIAAAESAKRSAVPGISTDKVD